MKKRVYIDVDGVLNALPSSWHTLDEEVVGWSDSAWQRKLIYGYWFNWNTELIDALNDIQAAGVEFRWLTTWCELAPEYVAPELKLAGSESWTVTQGVKHRDIRQYYEIGGVWWKHHLLDKDLAEDPADRVAWLDDDHAFYKTEVDDHILALAPDERVGLTLYDILDIKTFLEV